jgi:hypothetical protein
MTDDRFKYHQPTAKAIELHNWYRAQIESLVLQLERDVPMCRERSDAITKLQEAMFWGNAAIAREISAKADQ